LRLTVLGSSGTYPAPGKACSGYLVVEGDTSLLLDCGPGVIANLQVHATLEKLAGVIISHMHPDHFLDLVSLRYALTYGDHHRPRPLPVYLPPGGSEIWERVVAPLDESGGSFSASFDLSEYEEGESYRLGSLDIQPSAVRHYVSSYAFEVRAGARLVYSGDTGPCDELVRLARQADLFLCEATWLYENDETPPRERGHLTAREAGEIARKADVRRLLLTHISPDVDARKILEACRVAFGGEVSLAEEGQTYAVGKE